MGQGCSPVNQAAPGGRVLQKCVLEAAERLSDEDVLDLADALHDLLRARRAGRNNGCERYAVMRSDGEWRIVGARRRIGHFQSRELALEACARLARQARASGREVEMLVQEGAGELRAFAPPPR